MKTSKVILLSTFIFILYNMSFAQENRPITWVHGLGGDNGSWNVYQTHFESERKITSNMVHYDSNSGIVSAANAVTNQINTKSQKENENRIAICHSMGGLVGRQLDANQISGESVFGGLITVGSPHGGAPMVASYENGDVEKYSVEGCTELSKGPHKIGRILGGLFLAPVFDKWTPSKICNLAWDAMQNQFEGFNTAGMRELKPNSTFLQGLKTNPNTPKIGIYGTESDLVHARVLYSLTYKKPSELPLNDVKDYEGASKFRGMTTVYTFLEKGAHVAASLANMSFRYRLGSKLRDGAFKFGDGARWLKSSEGGWLKLIGAGGLRKTGTGTETFFVPGNNSGNVHPDPCSGDPDDPGYGSYQTFTYNIYETFSDPNDGLIPVPNMQLPGAIVNLEATGANHQENLNHPSMTARLTKIFDGEFSKSFEATRNY